MAEISNPAKTSVVTEEDHSSDNVAGYKWHRGVFFQATVVGITAFAAPGLWNAMNSVGAGGQQSPYLVMLVHRLMAEQDIFS
jgi:hypothetical protein